MNPACRVRVREKPIRWNCWLWCKGGWTTPVVRSGALVAPRPSDPNGIRCHDASTLRASSCRNPPPNPGCVAGGHWAGWATKLPKTKVMSQNLSDRAGWSASPSGATATLGRIDTALLKGVQSSSFGLWQGSAPSSLGCGPRHAVSGWRTVPRALRLLGTVPCQNRERHEVNCWDSRADDRREGWGCQLSCDESWWKRPQTSSCMNSICGYVFALRGCWACRSCSSTSCRRRMTLWWTTSWPTWDEAVTSMTSTKLETILLVKNVKNYGRPVC